MRTARLCGLTLAVLALHAIGWRIAIAGLPRFALPRAGVRRIELVAAAPRASPAPPAASPATPAAPARDRAPAAAHAPARAAAAGTAVQAQGHALGHAQGRAHAPRGPHPPAGDRGPRRAAFAAAQAWPVYATRAPPSATLHYVMVQGPRASGAPGAAELAWTHDDASFSLRIVTHPPGRPPREWLSVGGFDAAGVAPTRLAERERGRDKRAINFDHARRRVQFSGAAGALPLAAGAQDRWSWIAQLAAIAEARAARGRRVAPGTRWEVQVAGLRGELDRWTFRVLADAAAPAGALPTPGDGPATGVRPPGLLHVLREPERPYALRIEAWLSPSLHHLPVGLRLSTPPSAWSLVLWQAPADGAPPTRDAPETTGDIDPRAGRP